MSIESRPRVLLVIRAVIIRDGKVLLIRRSSHESHDTGFWEIPGGKIDAGSEVNSALEREVFEETGLIVKLIEPGMFVESSMLVEGKYSGLAYITLVGLTNLTGGDVKLSEEHDGACWVNFEEAMDKNLTFVTRKALTFFKDRI